MLMMMLEGNIWKKKKKDVCQLPCANQHATSAKSNYLWINNSYVKNISLYVYTKVHRYI